MTINEHIVESALDVVLGRLPVWDEDNGYCLRLTRHVVSHALGLNYDQFKARYWTRTVEDNTTGIPWAKDMQRSLRLDSAGIIVPFEERQAGDLLFHHSLAPQGHVAVLVTRYRALENTGSLRGELVSGYNRVSHVDEFPVPAHLQVFRLVA